MKLKWPQKIHKNRENFRGGGAWIFWLARIYTPVWFFMISSRRGRERERERERKKERKWEKKHICILTFPSSTRQWQCPRAALPPRLDCPFDSGKKYIYGSLLLQRTGCIMKKKNLQLVLSFDTTSLLKWIVIRKYKISNSIYKIKKVIN